MKIQIVFVVAESKISESRYIRVIFILYWNRQPLLSMLGKWDSNLVTSSGEFANLEKYVEHDKYTHLNRIEKIVHHAGQEDS